MLFGGVGCTSLLGLGGDFTVSGGVGGSTSSGMSNSSTGSAAGGGGAGSSVGGSGPGGSSTTGGGAPQGGGGQGGGATTGPISGHVVIYQLDAAGNQVNQLPVDLSQPGHVIQASTFTAGDMSWHLGTGTNLGSFEIDNVPPGPYTLDIDGEFYHLATRGDVDLDIYQANSPLATPLLNDPTIPFEISDMTPWVNGDTFERFAPTNGAYVFDQDYGIMAPEPAPFDTMITGTGDWRVTNDGGVFALLTPTDKIWLFHLGQFHSNPYTTIVDYVDNITTTQTDADGAVFTVTASFTQVAQNQNVKLHADIPGFEALIPLLNPAATKAAGTSFGYDYQVSPAAIDIAGQLGPTADLVLYNPPYGSPTVNFAFAYGQPFTGWNPYVSIIVQGGIKVQLPGLNPTEFDWPVTSSALLPSDPALEPGHIFEPQLTPAKNVKIDGHDFFATTMPTLSASPKVTWSAPDVGSATIWELRAYPVEGNGANTQIKNGKHVNLWAGDVHEITIPPGTLIANDAYMFFLVGYNCPDCHYEEAPGRIKIPNQQGTAISNLFQAPSN